MIGGRGVLALAGAVGVAALVSGCGGSTSSSQAPTSSAGTAVSSPSASSSVASVSAWGCTLLTTAQVEKLLGTTVSDARAATQADWTDVSGCLYSTATKKSLALTVAQHNTLVGDPALAPPGAPAGTTCLPEKPVTTCILGLPDGYSIIVISTSDPGPLAAALTLAAQAYVTNPMPRA